MSVPYKRDDYFYYTRYAEQKEYPIYARKRGSLEQPEEIILNANILAEGHEFFSVGGWTVSSGQDLLAYAVDVEGRRIHTAYIKNLSAGELLSDVLPNVSENLAWANDNRTLFYAKQDEITLREYQIYRHVVGTDPAKDQLVFQEDDKTFVSYIFKTKSKKFLMIVSAQTVSQEYRYLDADHPQGEFQVFLLRERGHDGASFGAAFAGSYAGLIPLLGLSFLQYSQQWHAAEIFRAAPILGPAPLCHGARQAVLCILTFPVLVLYALILWLVGVKASHLALLLPGLIALPIYALVPCLGGKAVPLSLPPEEAKSAGRGIHMMAVMMVSFALAGLATWSWSAGWFRWLLLVETILASGIYIAMRASLAGARWTPLE